MNAAARLVHQNVLSRQFFSTQWLNGRQIMTALLGAAAVLSALSIIYVTQVTRVLHAEYQHNLVEQDRLQVEHGQLLLERSTWMVPARIQQIAETKLGMVVPEQKSVVVVRE
jgi:cell division protein FtsL